MSVPQAMRRYRIQRPSVFVVAIYPLDPGLFGCLVDDLPNPPNGDMSTTLAWREPPRAPRQAQDPRLKLCEDFGRYHHRPVTARSSSWRLEGGSSLPGGRLADVLSQRDGACDQDRSGRS